jgi:hypothetical protein
MSTMFELAPMPDNDEGRPDEGPATAGMSEEDKPKDTSTAVDSPPLAGPEDDLDRWKDLEPVEDRDGKRRLVVNNWSLAFDRLLGLIGTAELSGLFRRSGELVHTPLVGEEGYIEPERGDDGPAQVQPITAGQLAAMVDINFAVGVWAKNKDKPKEPDWISKLMPRDVVNRAYDAARAGMQASALRRKLDDYDSMKPADLEALVRGPALRELQMVTHTPMIRGDGSILDRPGYDDRSKALFLPDADLIAMEKVAPDLAHVELYGPRDRLLDLTAEFPWVSDDDRANWYGLLFTPLMRAMLPPPYLMGMITAPNPRSGKWLLARILEMVHGGVRRSELPRDEAELGKILLAILVDTTAPVVVFDNVRGAIRSSTLEGVLASTEITDRYLGQSRMITGRNDRLFIMTGNNAVVAGDLGPRILPIQIDPKQPNPELREFTTDLYHHVPRHRGDILVDMLTIVRAWVLAGAPKEPDRSDEYGTWEGAMRGMLHWAEFPGTFGRATERTAALVRDEEQDEWHAFLVTIHDTYGDRAWTVKDLVNALECWGTHGAKEQLDPDTLPGDLADKWAKASYGNRAGFSKSLGRWFMNRAGRYAHGWRLEKIETTGHHAQEWKVIGP